MTYRQLFGNRKPVIAMLHLKGANLEDTLQRAKQETEIYWANGIDAVLVEDYFGTVAEAEAVLAWLQAEHPDKIYGVNILSDYKQSFELARRYGAKFIQIDSVSGHLPSKRDNLFNLNVNQHREGGDVLVLGGVRFKYQPVLSGRTLREDLEIAKTRCDAIIVTGEGTGRQTPEEKIQEFRWHLGSFPLLVGAGVSAENANNTFGLADGAIVGSYFKAGHKAGGDVEAQHVKTFMQAL